MRAYTLTHLSDAVLLRDLAALVAQDRTTTAALLAHIAEVDSRRLYLPAGYSSMHAYCVDELRLSEDSAYKRIQAARAARQFPALFAALAEGQLHLAAVCLLAPHLTPENADELLGVAAHQRKSEIERLLAQRFPRPEAPTMAQSIRAITPVPFRQLAPGQVAFDEPKLAGALAPGQGDAPAPRAETPLMPERFVLQLTIGKSTHDKLRYAQALLSHQIPSGDVAQVLERALDALICQLEKTKFAATTQPRPPRHSTGRKRYVPAHVRRAVWERDQGRCTFVSEAGHRCTERKFLEFDHVDPVARGGHATVERMRLRCRAHNQYEAECTFGAEFMEAKRNEARRAAGEARSRAAAADARSRAAAAETSSRAAAAEARARAAATESRARAAAKEQAKEVLAGLRQLGFRADEARRAAEYSETLPDATLEERMRAALKLLCPRPASKTEPGRALGAF